jgi:hypothetical protein
MPIVRHRRPGRPREREWPGKLGAWVREYTISRLASELEVDPVQVGRWARGDWRPSITRAIAVCELARAAGCDLRLEDFFERDVQRIRYRIRHSLPPT